MRVVFPVLIGEATPRIVNAGGRAGRQSMFSFSFPSGLQRGMASVREGVHDTGRRCSCELSGLGSSPNYMTPQENRNSFSTAREWATSTA